jgi:hypothetical protein
VTVATLTLEPNSPPPLGTFVRATPTRPPAGGSPHEEVLDGLGAYMPPTPCGNNFELAVTRLAIAAEIPRVMLLTILIAQSRHNAGPFRPRHSVFAAKAGAISSGCLGRRPGEEGVYDGQS